MRSLIILAVAALGLMAATACSDGSSDSSGDPFVSGEAEQVTDPTLLGEEDLKGIQSLLDSFLIHWSTGNLAGMYDLFSESIKQKCSIEDLDKHLQIIGRGLRYPDDLTANITGFHWTERGRKASGQYIFAGAYINDDVERTADGSWRLATDICAPPPVPTVTPTPDTSYEEELWRLVLLEDPGFSAVVDTGYGYFELPITVVNGDDREHKVRVGVSFLVPDHTRFSDLCGFDGDDEAMAFPGENQLICSFYGPDSISDINDFEIGLYSVGGYSDPSRDPEAEEQDRLEQSSQKAVAILRNEAFPRFTQADFVWFEEQGGVGASVDYHGFVGCDVAMIDQFEVFEAAADGGHDRVLVSTTFSPSCQHHINEPPDTINNLVFEVWVYPDGFTEIWLNELNFVR